MGWATQYIEGLQAGKTVSFRPTGGSMEGKISSGQLVTVAPLKEDPVLGDIVLCEVGGAQYLHLVKAVKDELFQIGNNKGRINGWVSRVRIYGKCIKVED